jgi:hypothetical protein
MHRLDTNPIGYFKWSWYAVLAFAWIIIARGVLTHDDQLLPLCYILAPLTPLLIWWFSTFKRVTLDGDTLLVHGSHRESRIPVSSIKRVSSFPVGMLSFITVVFRTDTDFGQRIRIKTFESDCEAVAKRLRRAAGIMADDFQGAAATVNRHPASVSADRKLLVRGWTEAELKKIIDDFDWLYRQRVSDGIATEMHASGEVIHVSVRNDCDFNLFCCLINFVQYPKDLGSRSRRILVAGRSTIGSDFLPSEQSLIGKDVVLYVPADDKRFDAVYAHVAGETYEFQFSSMRWRRVKDARLPAGLLELK